MVFVRYSAGKNSSLCQKIYKMLLKGNKFFSLRMGIEKICMTNKVNKIKIPKMICGLDEAGRGALAGPIVIAGVVLYSGFNFKKISPNIVVKDSKELSNKQREYLFNIIKKHCHRIIIEVISVKDINERGINWANIEGFRRIIKKIQADKYLIDGRWKLPDLREKNKNTKCIIKGDTKVMAILSAGVVAKIKRDKIMEKILERTIKSLEKINWKDFNDIALKSSTVLVDIFNNRRIIDLFLKNVVKNNNLISLVEHYDFFDKLVIYIDKKDRFRIRLHVFSGEDSNKHRPHCHRWNYSSVILQGAYKHNIYGTEDKIDENTKINNLNPILVQEEKVGSIYTLSHKVFHSIAAQKDTVSMLIRGPALKDRFLIMDKKVNKIWWEYGRESETIEEIKNKSVSPENFKKIINKIYSIVL